MRIGIHYAASLLSDSAAAHHMLRSHHEPTHLKVRCPHCNTLGLICFTNYGPVYCVYCDRQMERVAYTEYVASLNTGDTRA